MLWALTACSMPTAVHHSSADPGVPYQCPCCRKLVFFNGDMFQHSNNRDCHAVMHGDVPWNTNSLLVFGVHAEQRHQYVQGLLWANRKKLGIACRGCGSVTQALPVCSNSHMQRCMQWRGILVDIAVVQDNGALVCGISLSRTRLQATRIAFHADSMLDAYKFRLFTMVVNPSGDISNLANKDTSHHPVLLSDTNVATVVSHQGCEESATCCNVCHIALHVEPLHRLNIEKVAFVHKKCPAAALPKPSCRAPVVLRQPRQHVSTQIIRNTRYGDIQVVVNHMQWSTAGVSSQADMLLQWWAGEQEKPWIGLWCLQRACPCTNDATRVLKQRRCWDVTLEQFSCSRMAADVTVFDNDTVRYGPKAGITRRARMVRYQALRQRADDKPPPSAALVCMLLECDTVGLHQYYIT